jgi:hypothetical protein
MPPAPVQRGTSGSVAKPVVQGSNKHKPE